MKRIGKSGSIVPVSNASGLIKSGILAVALLALGGCVYGPDYGYVRGDGYSGDAYYGNAYYGGAYYDNDPWGYPYYGYGYGPSIGLGFYYDDYHRRHYYHGPHGGWGGGGYWHGGGYSGHGGYNGGHGGHSMPSRGGGATHAAPAAHGSSRGTH